MVVVVVVVCVCVRQRTEMVSSLKYYIKPNLFQNMKKRKRKKKNIYI